MKRIIVIAAMVAALLGIISSTFAYAATNQDRSSASHTITKAVKHPLVTCSGHGCDGQDPHTTGCANGSYYVNGAGQAPLRLVDGTQEGTAQLVYSPTCYTAWVHIHINFSVFCNTGNTAVLKKEAGSDGPAGETFAGGTNACAWDGKMLYSPTSFDAACGYLYDVGAGKNGPEACTQYS